MATLCLAELSSRELRALDVMRRQSVPTPAWLLDPGPLPLWASQAAGVSADVRPALSIDELFLVVNEARAALV